MNITVAGVGYVGLAQTVLLAQHNAVTAVTTTPAKAENINRGVSPIVDAEITDFLRTKPLTLTATVDAERAYRTADVVIIATPTDYDPERQIFNTSTVEAVLSLVGRVNPGPAAAGRGGAGHPDAVPERDGGRGHQALCQHVSRRARELLQ